MVLKNPHPTRRAAALDRSHEWRHDRGGPNSFIRKTTSSFVGFVGRCTWGLAATVALTGCSTYHPLPLDSAPAGGAWSNPSLEAVAVDAAKLEHPVLKPMTIDGRNGFSPDEIAVMAVIANPQLKVARDQRGVARAQVLQAGLLPNPQLGFSSDVPSTPGFVTGRTLGLGWEVTALIGYRERVAAAKATAKSVDLGIAWQEWQVAQGARLHAFRILSLEQQLPLVQATEAELAATRDLIRKALALGQRTAADVAAAVEAWNAANDARLELEHELATERFALNLVLGQPAEAPLKLRRGAALPDLPGSDLTASDLLPGLEKRRLDLVALAAGYESAEASLRAAIKEQFPKISLNLNRANDTSDVRTRGFGLTVDLPVFDRNQGAIAAGTASRQQLFDDYAARMADARSTVSQILSSLQAARSRLKTLQADLPELEQLATALNRAMETRNADLQAWREARVTLLTRRAEEARLQQDVLELGVALELATGRPLLTHPIEH
jgi:outer membrane protein TolC